MSQFQELARAYQVNIGTENERKSLEDLFKNIYQNDWYVILKNNEVFKSIFIGYPTIFLFSKEEYAKTWCSQHLNLTYGKVQSEHIHSFLVSAYHQYEKNIFVLFDDGQNVIGQTIESIYKINKMNIQSDDQAPCIEFVDYHGQGGILC